MNGAPNSVENVAVGSVIPLEVEDSVVAPAVLVVADQSPVGLR